MSRTIDNCQLEIDHERGTIYVHSDKGMTVLRISHLPAIPKGTAFIDISYMDSLAVNYVPEQQPRRAPSLQPPLGGEEH